MFERFTEEARQVVVAAQEEARRLGHGHVGTEHILIALSRLSDDLPGRALSEAGVDADAVRAKVTEMFGPGDEPPSGQIPFTSAAKKSLELALRAALKLGHNWIESGHVLLGLVDVGPSPGYETLSGLGVDVDSLRDRVVALLADSDRPQEHAHHAHHAARGPSIEVRQVGREPGHFAVGPDSRLQRLLMAAAGRALQQARREFRIEDVLEALKDSPPDEESSGPA